MVSTLDRELELELLVLLRGYIEDITGHECIAYIEDDDILISCGSTRILTDKVIFMDVCGDLVDFHADGFIYRCE
jgi:hypothetical protein